MTTKMTWWERLVVTALLLLIGAWNVLMIGDVALALDCTWDCAQNLACQGATQFCPQCDLGIQDACSNYQQVDFPNTVISAYQGGNRHADLQANVTCMEMIDCANGSYNWVMLCFSGFCNISPVTLQYCLTCEATGTVHNLTANTYTCTSAGCGS